MARGILITAALAVLISVSADAQEAPVAVSSSPVKAAGLTFRACYVRALETSADIAERSAAMRATQGRYLSALSAVLPRVTFASFYLWQGISHDSQIPSYFAAGDSMQNRFTAEQTLFAGFREINGIRAIRYEREQRLQEQRRAGQTLLASVAEAFFTAVEMREAVKLLEGIDLVYARRLDDLAARVRVGRSRKSELSATLTQRSQNAALMESVKSREILARRQLEYITGLTITGALQDDEIPFAPAHDETAYRELSARRADVLAAENAWRSAQKQINAAAAAFFPTVDASGNYYTRNSGRYQGLNWDAMITLSVPLLPVADAAGALKQARAGAEASLAQYRLARNTALFDVNTALENARSAASREAAYRKALTAAEDNYLLQQEDYAHNLISNLDLLQAIQTLQNARQDYLHALYDVKRAYWRLRSAAGESL